MQLQSATALRYPLPYGSKLMFCKIQNITLVSHQFKMYKPYKMQNIQKQFKNSQPQTKHVPKEISKPQKLLHKNPIKISNPFRFIISCHQWLPSERLQSFYSHLFYKSCLLLYEVFKLRNCAILSVLLGILSTVKACWTTVTPVTQISEEDLLVCVPKSNTSSCVRYINSSINGLIELNESVYPALRGFRGKYDYQMISRINPFWLSFEPPNDSSYYIMGALYMIIFGFGITGNGLVIYMFARCKSLRTASNILVFNLAISDFMIICKCPIAVYNNFMRGPALGDWGCRLYGFIGGFSGCASIGMLTLISVERYSVVVNPLDTLHLNNKSKCFYYLLSLAWLEAFFFSVIPLLEVGLSVYVPEGYLTTCSFDYLDKSLAARVFMFIFFMFGWCLPLTIIFYCYFHILKAVLMSKNIQSNQNKHQTEVRLAFIVLLVIGLWFLAWTPYAIVAMTGVFGMEIYLTPTRSMIPALFCKTAACLNPFMYTISHKKFRNEFQRLFCKRIPRYQYSMTRSSYLMRTSRVGRCPVENIALSVLNTQSNGLKSRQLIDKATLGGAYKSAVCEVGDSADKAIYHRTHHKRSFSRKQINPVISSKDARIFVLELEDFNLKAPPLETNF